MCDSPVVLCVTVRRCCVRQSRGVVCDSQVVLCATVRLCRV